MWNDDGGVDSECFDVAQGLRQGCVRSQQLFNVFFRCDSPRRAPAFQRGHGTFSQILPNFKSSRRMSAPRKKALECASIKRRAEVEDDAI